MFYYRVEGKYRHVDALIIAPKADFVDEIASRGVPTPDSRESVDVCFESTQT